MELKDLIGKTIIRVIGDDEGLVLVEQSRGVL